MNQTRPILLIDDSDTDAWLFEQALRKNDIHNPIKWVSDGGAARKHLNGKSEASETPFCIVLDLKLPKENGLEFLEWLSQQHELRKIPAVVFSGSIREQDRKRALELGARCFLLKTGYSELVQEICLYWKKCVT